jgi:hypothetical protein
LQCKIASFQTLFFPCSSFINIFKSFTFSSHALFESFVYSTLPGARDEVMKNIEGSQSKKTSPENY